MNIYDRVLNRYKNNPVVILLFLASLTMLIIGCWLFVEDTWSSKLALEDIQTHVGIRVQIFDLTYWVMSLAPQIASIIFTYMFMSSDKEYKWLGFAFLAQGFDFMADMWYRGNGAALFDSWQVFFGSALMTFLYFSVGSEFFITIGFGLVVKLFTPAMNQFLHAIGSAKTIRMPNAASYNSTASTSIDRSSSNRPGQPRAEVKQGSLREPPISARPTSARPTSARPAVPEYRPTNYGQQGPQGQQGDDVPPWLRGA